MTDGDVMPYTALLDLEWFADNNGVWNSREQELVLQGNGLVAHAPL